MHSTYVYIDRVHTEYWCTRHPSVLLFSSCWSDPLLPDLGKQDSHHFECHLVSQLPQVLLLHCVPLHPRWLHHCHPTCPQWHLPHSDLPPTRHHLQDWGGGCEEGRRSRRTEGKGHTERFYWEYVCERMFITERVRFCQSGNILSFVLRQMRQLTDTTDVVPSGTISSTPTSTALPPKPTASSETAGEPTPYMLWRHAFPHEVLSPHVKL